MNLVPDRGRPARSQDAKFTALPLPIGWTSELPLTRLLRPRSSFLAAVVAASLLIAGPHTSAGDDGGVPQAVERVRRLWDQAQRATVDNPADVSLAWTFARASFDYAEFATNAAQRARLAEAGIEAARRSVRLAPDLAATHYYLAMNLGQLARTRTLGALPLVTEMEIAFKKAAGLDPAFDEAGPDRCLGLLYRDAPGWPISVGSKAKARTHLKRAVALAPAYPENRLNLIESHLLWNQPEEARTEAKPLATDLPDARKRLAGPDWETAWADWDRRWRALPTAVRPAEKPGP
jgi:Flp pilus assembly protein TadD